MNTVLEYETIDIDGCSVTEVIAALQTWEAENPEAVNTNFSILYDGEGAYAEIAFQRPMTELEINIQKIQRANYDAAQEARDRNEYVRLKAKFEGN
jgi:hypothetical protein